MSPTHSSRFDPGWPLRHAGVQSALASFKPRNWSRRRHPMALAAAAHILDCGDGVRLMGLHSPQPLGKPPKGLVVLIHGWEGCHESVYLLSIACTLYDEGYNVFRLNLRDHGGTHHLNEGMFHSARLDEVLGAIRAVQTIDPTQPLFVIGFSLGGNFALRVGLRGPAQGVAPRLSVGVCPAINPGATLRALDEGPRLFHRYFIKKWHRTLHAKAAAWPARYDFTDIWSLTSFVEITARFVERYTEYGQLDRYLAAYTLVPDMIAASPSPLAIITAQDDPVVPFKDFGGLDRHDGLSFIAPRYGGHCGFIENFRLRSWAEHRILELLARA
ncbi:MAG: alpha/beta fold hydrolase [Gammaproteobacteria bacterium]|nr:alpha/beta fold hydrolase [Gammaproteobacteria bacterium]